MENIKCKYCDKKSIVGIKYIGLDKELYFEVCKNHITLAQLFVGNQKGLDEVLSQIQNNQSRFCLV